MCVAEKLHTKLERDDEIVRGAREINCAETKQKMRNANFDERGKVFRAGRGVAGPVNEAKWL